ncbi:hypothetical protein ACVWZ9_004741 [Pseudomonas chlororaphis]
MLITSERCKETSQLAFNLQTPGLLMSEQSCIIVPKIEFKKHRSE